MQLRAAFSSSLPPPSFSLPSRKENPWRGFAGFEVKENREREEKIFESVRNENGGGGRKDPSPSVDKGISKESYSGRVSACLLWPRLVLIKLFPRSPAPPPPPSLKGARPSRNHLENPG